MTGLRPDVSATTRHPQQVPMYRRFPTTASVDTWELSHKLLKRYWSSSGPNFPTLVSCHPFQSETKRPTKKALKELDVDQTNLAATRRELVVNVDRLQRLRAGNQLAAVQPGTKQFQWKIYMMSFKELLKSFKKGSLPTLMLALFNTLKDWKLSIFKAL